ncbi:MAG: hypothetical protein P8Z31_02070 [Gammaproteobacteria bacterium]
MTEIETAARVARAGRCEAFHACAHDVLYACSGRPEGIDPGVLASSRVGAQFELPPGDIDSARLVP